MRRTRVVWSFVAAALVAGSVAVGTPAAAAPGDVDVQLLALSDFHGRFTPQTGGDGTLPGFTGAVGGAAYMATLLDQRAAAFAAASDNGDGSFFVGAGDLISASPFESSVYKDEPTIEVLNALGLDYSSVGNHEFDRGFEELQRIIDGGCTGAPNVDSCFTDSTGDTTFDGADFPYLGANVLDTATGEPVLPEYSIIETGGVKLGLIGVVTSDVPTLVTPTGIVGLTFEDEATAINRVASELQAQGVQALAVLIHEGGLQNPAATSFYNQCNGLSGPIVDINANTTAAVDLIVSAHTHVPYDCSLLDPAGNLRPVTQAGFYGKAITDIRMEISTTTGDIDRATITADNIPVGHDVTPDPEIQAIVDYWLAESAGPRGEVLGTQSADLDRAYLAGAAVRTSESGFGNFIADAQLDSVQDNPAVFGNPVAAFMNPGGIRADINCATRDSGEPSGTITFGEAFTAQPFSNNVNVETISGAAIDQTLEQQFIDPATGLERTMLHLSVSASLHYDFDARLPLGARVSNVRIDGVLIDPAANYLIVANSFLTAGGDGFSALISAGEPAITGPLDVDALADYIGENSPVAPPPLDRANSLDPTQSFNDDGTGTGPCPVFDPAVIVSPDPVRRGGTVTVTATGFEPGDEATVVVPARWTAPAPQTVGPEGTVTFVIDVPTNSKVGPNTITVNTTSGSASDGFVVQKFNPKVTASRNVVAPGQSFTVSGSGFIPGQLATLVVPAGWTAPAPAPVGVDGTVVFTVVTPVDAPNGRARLTVTTPAGSATDAVQVFKRRGPIPN